MVHLGMMLWQITLAFIKYYSYPTETNLSFNASTTVIFPAVTFCNVNPIRLFAVNTHDELQHLEDLLEKVIYYILSSRVVKLLLIVIVLTDLWSNINSNGLLKIPE